jgi:hypothetical protein
MIEFSDIIEKYLLYFAIDVNFEDVITENNQIYKKLEEHINNDMLLALDLDEISNNKKKYHDLVDNFDKRLSNALSISPFLDINVLSEFHTFFPLKTKSTKTMPFDFIVKNVHDKYFLSIFVSPDRSPLKNIVEYVKNIKSYKTFHSNIKANKNEFLHHFELDPKFEKENIASAIQLTSNIQSIITTIIKDETSNFEKKKKIIETDLKQLEQAVLTAKNKLINTFKFTRSTSTLDLLKPIYKLFTDPNFQPHIKDYFIFNFFHPDVPEEKKFLPPDYSETKLKKLDFYDKYKKNSKIKLELYIRVLTRDFISEIIDIINTFTPYIINNSSLEFMGFVNGFMIGFQSIDQFDEYLEEDVIIFSMYKWFINSLHSPKKYEDKNYYSFVSILYCYWYNFFFPINRVQLPIFHKNVISLFETFKISNVILNILNNAYKKYPFITLEYSPIEYIKYLFSQQQNQNDISFLSKLDSSRLDKSQYSIVDEFLTIEDAFKSFRRTKIKEPNEDIETLKKDFKLIEPEILKNIIEIKHEKFEIIKPELRRIKSFSDPPFKLPSTPTVSQIPQKFLEPQIFFPVEEEQSGSKQINISPIDIELSPQKPLVDISQFEELPVKLPSIQPPSITKFNNIIKKYPNLPVESYTKIIKQIEKTPEAGEVEIFRLIRHENIILRPATFQPLTDLIANINPIDDSLKTPSVNNSIIKNFELFPSAQFKKFLSYADSTPKLDLQNLKSLKLPSSKKLFSPRIVDQFKYTAFQQFKTSSKKSSSFYYTPQSEVKKRNVYQQISAFIVNSCRNLYRNKNLFIDDTFLKFFGRENTDLYPVNKLNNIFENYVEAKSFNSDSFFDVKEQDEIFVKFNDDPQLYPFSTYMPFNAKKGYNTVKFVIKNNSFFKCEDVFLYNITVIY